MKCFLFGTILQAHDGSHNKRMRSVGQDILLYCRYKKIVSCTWTILDNLSERECYSKRR
ncbi:MAG: hypothetical protein ACI96G_000095 [Flavobacterium sp.]|jgi:hypothetical protein